MNFVVFIATTLDLLQSNQQLSTNKRSIHKNTCHKYLVQIL